MATPAALIAKHTTAATGKTSAATVATVAAAVAALPTNGARTSKAPLVAIRRNAAATNRVAAHADDAMDEDEDEAAVRASAAPGETFEALGDSDEDEDETVETDLFADEDGGGEGDVDDTYAGAGEDGKADEEDEEGGGGGANGEEGRETRDVEYDNDGDPDADPNGGGDQLDKAAPPKKAAPKKRAARAAPDAEARQQNIKALRGVKGSADFQKEAFSDIARAAATVIAFDFYNNSPSSYETDSLWGSLLALTAAGSVPAIPCDKLLPDMPLQKAALNLSTLNARFTLLKSRVEATDAAELRRFTETFLCEAVDVTDVGRDVAVAVGSPLRCEMVGGLLPAEFTTRLRIKYAPGVGRADQLDQTIVVAQKFALLIQRLVLVARLPAALYQAGLKVLEKKVKARAFVAGQTTKLTAINMIIAETSEASLFRVIQTTITKAITDLCTSPTKFTEVRKLVIKGSEVATEEAEPAAMVF